MLSKEDELSRRYILSLERHLHSLTDCVLSCTLLADVCGGIDGPTYDATIIPAIGVHIPNLGGRDNERSVLFQTTLRGYLTGGPLTFLILMLDQDASLTGQPCIEDHRWFVIERHDLTFVLTKIKLTHGWLALRHLLLVTHSL